jgi:hypothetical protein
MADAFFSEKLEQVRKREPLELPRLDQKTDVGHAIVSDFHFVMIPTSLR